MMEHYISRDKEKLDVEKIHREITATYWAGQRSMEETLATIAHSSCFGIYDKAGEQLGFTRLVTDQVTFAYLMDVIIFAPHRGKGLGKALLGHIMGLPEIQKLTTLALKTKDAHGLYEGFGFKRVGDSALWMSIDKLNFDNT